MKEKVKKLYANQDKSIEDITKELNISKTKLYKIIESDCIQKRKRNWSKEEIEYLKNNYGLKPLDCISKKLKRSERAIEHKTLELKLGAATKKDEYLTPGELGKILKVCPKTVVRWIQNRGLKAEKKKITAKRINWFISIDDFWKWAEENRNIYNVCNIDEFALGIEPKWVKSERKKDNGNNKKRVRNRYTKREDLIIRDGIRSGKTLEEIANILNREVSSVIYRNRVLEKNKCKPR